MRAGLTQTELCDRMKRDKNFVSTVEIGTRMLDVLEFCEYAAALGRRPTELLSQVLKPGRAKSVVGRVRRPSAGR